MADLEEGGIALSEETGAAELPREEGGGPGPHWIPLGPAGPCWVLEIQLPSVPPGPGGPGRSRKVRLAVGTWDAGGPVGSGVPRAPPGPVSVPPGPVDSAAGPVVSVGSRRVQF